MEPPPWHMMILRVGKSSYRVESQIETVWMLSSVMKWPVYDSRTFLQDAEWTKAGTSYFTIRS